MSKICVEIEIDTETGDLMVHECEPKMEDPEMGEMPGQTYQDIDSALQAAAAILTGERSAGGSSELQDAMSGGYNKVKGGGMMGRPAGMQFAEE